VVWRASAGLIEHWYLRATLAALIVLSPVVGVETLDNVTNSIWFLLFASFWLLLWRPATFARAAWAGGLLFLAAVSNGGTVLLLPLLVLRAVAIRDRRDVLIVTAFAAGVAVQLGLSWHDMNVENVAGRRLTIPPQWHWDLVPAYAQQIVGGALTGGTITGYLWRQLGTPFEVALGAALIAFVIFALARTNVRTRVLVPLTVAISLATFLVSISRGAFRLFSADFLWPHGISRGGSHYLVVPTLLLLSAAFICLDERPRFLSPTAWTSLLTGVVLFVLLIALSSFNVGDAGWRGSPTWSAALDNARSKCLGKPTATMEIPIAPSGARSLFTLSNWTIPLACNEVRSASTSDTPEPASASQPGQPLLHRLRASPRQTNKQSNSVAQSPIAVGGRFSSAA
jgi:hypothetical protein